MAVPSFSGLFLRRRGLCPRKQQSRDNAVRHYHEIASSSAVPTPRNDMRGSPPLRLRRLLATTGREQQGLPLDFRRKSVAVPLFLHLITRSQRISGSQRSAGGLIHPRASPWYFVCDRINIDKSTKPVISFYLIFAPHTGSRKS